MSEVNYSKYKIIVDPESKRTQGLRVGDIVRRQYSDSARIIYSLMIVLDSGVDIITKADGTESKSAYFIGALIDGDEPKTGEILDFVRVSNLFDADRSGALYLTASDAGAPYMDVLDGIGTVNSLCFPDKMQTVGGIPMGHAYMPVNQELITPSYTAQLEDNNRIIRLLRTNTANTSNSPFGLQQHIVKSVNTPTSIIVAFKVRGSKAIDAVNLRMLDYYHLPEEVWAGTISVSTGWQYCLKVLNLTNTNLQVGEHTYPQHSLMIDLKGSGLSAGDWVDIADFNIIQLSDIATFSNSHQGRLGKLAGIIDPVFGQLSGFGAYFPNFYATRNVNIAGTLSAGDENGAGSTFYVGRIHKNCYLNSINPTLNDESGDFQNITNPVGIGKIIQIPANDGSIIQTFKNIQSAEWIGQHIGEKVTFSFYCYVSSLYEQFTGSRHICTRFAANKPIKSLHSFVVDTMDEWVRISFSFVIEKDLDQGNNPFMFYILDESKSGMFICAPQLEFGDKVSIYQPTDGVLQDTDAYGAWFSRGGIGGTIQNPLLKLNEDGSIESGDGAFKIKADGTGFLANGRLKWSEDTIELQGITVKWTDFDEETQENMKNKSIQLVGPSVIHYKDSTPSVESIMLSVNGININLQQSTLSWYYFNGSNEWERIPDVSGIDLSIAHNGPYWKNRNTLSIMCICKSGSQEYKSSMTINKQYDGQDAYMLIIDSSNGNIFKNGDTSTILSATVWKGGVDITSQLDASQFLWTRKSADEAGDAIWNSTEHRGKTLEIDKTMVSRKAVFSCDLYNVE